MSVIALGISHPGGIPYFFKKIIKKYLILLYVTLIYIRSSLQDEVSCWPRTACASGFFLPMNRVIYFIDGFNLYHAIDDQIRLCKNYQFKKYKWLDLFKLASLFVTSKDHIERIYYFTALTLWNREKVKRHQTYIRVLESKDIKIIYGEFRHRDRYCPLCKKTYRTFEEKRTDVNIAILLLKLAFDDCYDTAIIVSGDSDLIPAVKTIKSIFPDKQIGIIIPIGRRAELLKQTATFYMKIKEKHLKSSLFPLSITIGAKTFYCPAEWQ